MIKFHETNKKHLSIVKSIPFEKDLFEIGGGDDLRVHKFGKIVESSHKENKDL